MLERNFIKCPVDEHKCNFVNCIEYEGTPEMPCRVAVDSLAKAASDISKINLSLSLYENPSRLTMAEVANSVNITPTIQAAAERLNIDFTILLIRILERAEKNVRRRSSR